LIGAVAAIDLGGDTPETPEEKVCTHIQSTHIHTQSTRIGA
jgi:hypothetical protein